MRKFLLVLSVFCAMGFMAQSQEKVIVLDEKQFAEKIGKFGNSGSFSVVAKRPAVVDFYADWCGPCKRLAPIMDELATEYEGMVDFYKLNVDNCPALAMKVGAKSIPLVMFFPSDGSEPQAIVGLYPKEEIQKVIQFLFFKTDKK